MKVAWSELPSGPCEWFHGEESTYPTPEEIRAHARHLHGAAIVRTCRPPTLYFHDIGLLVKWGRYITIAEGQCLWFIRKHIGNHVAVPRIFGWKQDGEEVFLYMELVHGDTLMDRWGDLSTDDRGTVCAQLKKMIHSWQQIQRPKGFGLCQIGGQALRDIMFQDGGSYPAGPFASLTEFHDAFAGMVFRRSPKANPRELCNDLTGFDDTLPVVFAHADLDQSNILISKAADGPVRIVAIIDWHQSGWYPEHWERLKAESVGFPECDWSSEYVPKILPAPKFEYYYSWEFVRMAII